jgi:hypothetical protein
LLLASVRRREEETSRSKFSIVCGKTKRHRTAGEYIPALHDKSERTAQPYPQIVSINFVVHVSAQGGKIILKWISEKITVKL